MGFSKKIGVVKLRIMWARLEYHVYANGINLHYVVWTRLESTDIDSEQAQQESASILGALTLADISMEQITEVFLCKRGQNSTIITTMFEHKSIA